MLQRYAQTNAQCSRNAPALSSTQKIAVLTAAIARREANNLDASAYRAQLATLMEAR